MSINPQIIEQEGKKAFAVLPYEEFLAIKASLEDYENLKDLREAKAETAADKTVKLADVRDELLSN